MFVQNCIDNDWDDGRKVRLAIDLDQDNYQATSLENSATKSVSIWPPFFNRVIMYLPTVGHNISMASFHGHFNVHWEVAESVDLESLANIS